MRNRSISGWRNQARGSANRLSAEAIFTVEAKCRKPRRGMPTTWVRVPGNADAAAILRAIRQGHVTLSANPDGALLAVYVGGGLAQAVDAVTCPAGGEIEVRVRCRRGAGGELRLLDQNGVLFSQRIREEDESVQVRLAVAASHYVRAELRDSDSNMLALTNPVYLDRS